MSEGNVFLTTWTRTETGYRVWVKRRPKLFAEGSKFDEADRRLWEVIGLATGDGENMHEYVPPAPNLESAGPSERGRLWVLGVSSGARMVNPSGLFEGGLCEQCLMPRGPRTRLPLAVDHIESRVQASVVSLPRAGPGVGPRLRVFTEDFLVLLTAEERARFEWRPITLSRRGKRNFLELVHRTPPMPYVAVKGYQAYYGVCELCGWKWVVPEYVKGRPFFHVADSDVPRPVPSLMAVGNLADLGLAASEARWSDLVGMREMHGIKGSIVAIVAENEVERNPLYVPRPPEKRPVSASPTWFER